MIRHLRQRHRVIVCTLGVLLPVAFSAGLAARKPVQVPATVSSRLAGQANDFGRMVWSKADLWPGQRISTSLRQDAAGSVAVELMIRDLVKPDLLVYWVAGKERAVEVLPDNARLLGPLSNNSPLSIPVDARGETGRLMLYSLADHDLVAVSRMLTL